MKWKYIIIIIISIVIISSKNINPSDKHMRRRGFLEVFILTIYFDIVDHKTTLKDDIFYCAYILRNKDQRRISSKGSTNFEVSKHSGWQAVGVHLSNDRCKLYHCHKPCLR